MPFCKNNAFNNMILQTYEVQNEQKIFHRFHINISFDNGEPGKGIE